MLNTEEYFLVVVQEKSISKAAEKLFMSQQNLSNHIARLEKKYGKLFLRRPKFSLTPIGSALYHTLQQIRILEQGLQNQLQEWEKAPYGVIRFGIHSARARVLFPGILARYRKQYPQVTIQLFLQDTITNETMLQNGELDIFLGIDAHQSPNFHHIPLFHEPICLIANAEVLQAADVVTKNGEIELGDLSRLSFLLSPPISNFRQKIDRFLATYSISLNERMTIGDFEIQLLLAGQSEGACFCASSFFPKLRQINQSLPPEKQLRILPVHGMDLTSDISLVCHRLAFPSRILKGFVQAIKGELLPKFASHT